MSEEQGLRFLFDERYSEALLHKPKGHVVLGKKLRPFSMWHKLQLEYSQSKILLGNAKMWDLWCAVQICQTQYPVRARWESRWGMWNALWHRLWKMRYKRKNNHWFSRELSRFIQYVNDYQSGPKLWGGKGSAIMKYGEALEALGRELGDQGMIEEGLAAQEHAQTLGSEGRDIDETLEQVSIAVKFSNESLADVWNMPAGELSWLNVALMKAGGAKINIWTPVEDEKFEAHKKVRFEKIQELAEELAGEEEYAGETKERISARAAVRYWERVIRNVS
jgi:hypothetical protein